MITPGTTALVWWLAAALWVLILSESYTHGDAFMFVVSVPLLLYSAHRVVRHLKQI